MAEPGEVSVDFDILGLRCTLCRQSHMQPTEISAKAFAEIHGEHQERIEYLLQPVSGEFAGQPPLVMSFKKWAADGP